MKTKLIGCCIVFLLLLTGSTFAQWQTEYEQEYGNAFYSVHFPTSTTGYIVGSDGIILKSTDGGDTWAEQASPVTTTLNCVYFTDATTGWAVGAGGVIIYTTDGTNWAAHDSSGVMTTTAFNAVYFIGTRGWFGGDTGIMYMTNDGGANFTTPTTNPAADDVNGIAFVNSSVGYAAIDNGTIMWTDDGGDTWTLAAVDLGPYPYTRYDIEVIMTVDDTLAVASGWGSMVGPQPTIILISEDAGKTWENPDDSYGYFTHAYGYGLTMFHNDDILLVGGGASSVAPVLHSNASDLTSWSTTYPFFGDDLRDCCAVPGTGDVVAVGDEGCIAKSDDYGTTWTYLYDAGNGAQGWFKFGTYGLETIVIGSGATILKLDENGNAYDFGVIAPKNWGPYLEDVDCDIITYPPVDTMVAGKIWYACGRNFYLCKTTDAGENWTQLQHAPNNFDGFYGMFWFNENDGVLVGDSASYGAVWTTNDGGVNLDLVYLYTLTDQLNSVHFSPTDPDIGVAVGQDNLVVYTTDGGATWTQGTEDIGSSSADLLECHMIDSDTAFAVGDAGLYCKTTDGGQNWLVQPSFTSVKLNDIYFSEPTFGWASGDDQIAFYTDDGGATWTDISPTLPVSTHDVNAIYLNGRSGKLYIGCDYGTVQSRSDAVTGGETPINLPFVLKQNFPNPFNPSTTISFSIDKIERVTLNVYDASGRLVARVLDKEMGPGTYDVSFQAEGLASGVYFYKLTTSTKEQTRKMILLR